MTTKPSILERDRQPTPAEIEQAVKHSRLCWRVTNAFMLQAELIVLSCLISDTGVYGRTWLSLPAIEQCVDQKLRELQTQISLPKPVRWILERARLARLVECYNGSYRLTRVGLACVIDHSNRLQRHNAREWDQKWQQEVREVTDL